MDEAGQPQVRTLVLRELDERLALFINATSPKQRQLNTGLAAICAYYASIQIQYRLICRLEAIPAQRVAESWQLRPDMPKRLDWYYMTGRKQSTEVSDRETLSREIASVELPDPLVAPTSAVGYWLIPQEAERLDLGQPDGLHARQRYLRDDQGGWRTVTLVP